MVSRVHPNSRNGRPEEGGATRLRVMPQEILADLRAGMPRGFLIAKYRIPQKGSLELLQKAVQHSTTPRELNELFDRDGRASVHKKTHPSHLSLCFTREERRYLVKDFRDDAVRALCVDACLRASTEKSLVQQQAIEDTNKYLMTLPEETRNMMLSLLRKMLVCFEAAGGDNRVVGLPSEVSTAVVTWLKQLLEDVFDEVPPPLDRCCSSFSATSDEEEEEESEARRGRKCVPSQPKRRFCRQSCPQTSFHHSAYAKSVADGIHQEDNDTLECVPRNGEEDLPSIGRKKTEEKRNPVTKTSVPVRRGQRKRTRSAVGQEWDLLIALKRHKAVEKSQQQKSRRGKGELDQSKAWTICRGRRADPRENGLVDPGDDEAEEFEKQRSFYAKLLFSDDSADGDDFFDTTTTSRTIKQLETPPEGNAGSTREQKFFNILHNMERNTRSQGDRPNEDG